MDERQQTEEAIFSHWQDCTAAAVAGDPEAIGVCLKVSTALEACRDAELPEREIREMIQQAVAALARWHTDRGGKSNLPALTEPRTLAAAEYALNTSQEFEAFMQAAADGKSGANWKSDRQGDTRSHALANLPHYVQIALTPDERAAGLSIDALERLTYAQDADCIFTVLYVSDLLAPVGILPKNQYAGGWVSLDDIMQKIGADPETAADRLRERARVWNYLRFAARAHVRGKRSIPYHDPITGEDIPSRIDGPIWAFLDRQYADLPLFPEEDVPRAVEIVVSQEWSRLSQDPRTAQFLPLGQRLGSIPGNKPSGAWARVVGLKIANLWRRDPHAFLKDGFAVTRYELLTHYLPKVAPVDEILDSANPRRAIDYWHGCLETLVEARMISRRGEAARGLEEMRAEMPRQGWKDKWKTGKVVLWPGPDMLPAIEAAAAAKYEHRPRQLSPKRRRGRPAIRQA